VSSTLIAVVAAVVSALFLGIASVADQRSTKQVQTRKALSPRIFADLARQPLWLAAILANIVGFALQVTALSFGSLALVQPLLVGDLVWAVLISWYLRKRANIQRPGGPRADAIMFCGVGATTIGVAGFLAIGRPSAGNNHASLGTLPQLVIFLIIVVGGCLLLGAKKPNLQPLALAVACGVCYGVAAFSVKLVTAEVGHGPGELFTDWPIYILLVVGPAGFLLNQDAFQEGTFLAPVQAILTSADPVISIALGILWLGVHVRNTPGAIAGQVASLLVMIAGIVVTAQHAPQVMAGSAESPPGVPEAATEPLSSPSREPWTKPPGLLRLGGAVSAAGGGTRRGLVALRGGRVRGGGRRASARVGGRARRPGAAGRPGAAFREQFLEARATQAAEGAVGSRPVQDRDLELGGRQPGLLTVRGRRGRSRGRARG
jgi:hypothetical protein